MKTVYYTASSLDGFIATEADDLSWLMQFGAEDPTYQEFIGRIGAVAMGKSTYLWLLNHHRAAKGDAPFEWMYEQPSWVFSSQELERPASGDVRFVRGDVRPVYEEIARVAGGKDLWIVGGGDLVGQFHDRGLLDELIVTFAPVTLGSGKPLLPRRITAPPLELVSVAKVGPFAQLTYRVARE
jgi:dihydrofolate reductase